MSTDSISSSPTPRQKHEQQYCFAQTNSWKSCRLKSWSKAHGKLYRMRNFPQATVGWEWDGDGAVLHSCPEPSTLPYWQMKNVSCKQNYFCLLGFFCNQLLIFLGVISHFKVLTNHTEPLFFIFAKGFSSVSYTRMHRLTPRLLWLQNGKNIYHPALMLKSLCLRSDSELLRGKEAVELQSLVSMIC